MKLRMLWIACAACLLFATIGIAASTIKLKDGRTIIGDYKKIGGSYSILEANGTRTFVNASEIVSIDGKALVATAGSTASGGTAGATTAQAAASGGAAFKSAFSKAEKVDSPIQAVSIWEKFIEQFPTSADLPTAKKELEKWNALYKDGAEKVKGKWLSGKELKELKKKCDALYADAVDPSQEMGVKGIAGLRKLDEILAIYPNHFGANWEKGFYHLIQATRTQQGSNDSLNKAIRALETTTQLASTVPEVWANLAIGYSFRREYQKSIEAAYRAVQIRDQKELVQQLAAAIYAAPDAIRNVNPKVREINEDAQLLFRKHGVSGGGGWLYLRPTQSEGGADAVPTDIKRPPGVIGNGSGFLVTADGYIITNKHVVDSGEGHYYRVRFDDGTEKRAEVITTDDKYDLALLRIKADAPLPFLKIADDNPNPGAQAMVLGYPSTIDGRFSLQVTSGDVKSLQIGDEYEVWYNLSTTQGNSGGPIVDKAGRVIGVLSAGASSQNDPRFRVTYVLGIGPNQIEDFLTRYAEKAPKLQYEPQPAGGVFEAESLAIKCRKSTLLVLIIRGEPGADGDKGAAKDGTPKPDAPEAAPETPPTGGAGPTPDGPAAPPSNKGRGR